eukprot:scaffold9901_cov65-Phaeocystis_antarctica.AAC.2
MQYPPALLPRPTILPRAKLLRLDHRCGCAAAVRRLAAVRERRVLGRWWRSLLPADPLKPGIRVAHGRAVVEPSVGKLFHELVRQRPPGLEHSGCVGRGSRRKILRAE